VSTYDLVYQNEWLAIWKTVYSTTMTATKPLRVSRMGASKKDRENNNGE
jgi:hypothetical protein